MRGIGGHTRAIWGAGPGGHEASAHHAAGQVGYRCFSWNAKQSRSGLRQVKKNVTQRANAGLFVCEGLRLRLS